MKRLLVVAISAAVLAAGVWWWLRPASVAVTATPATVDATPPQPSERAAAALPAPRVVIADAETLRKQMFAGPPSHETSGPYLVGDTLDELLARAAAGDVMAMRSVGNGLHGCLSAFVDPDARRLKEQLDRDLQSNMDVTEGRAERDRVTYDHYEGLLAYHVDCMAIGRERAASGLGWLERAARAGDPEAKAEYASRALDNNAYPDEAAMLSDLDEVIRRRDLADTWVREAIESGERQALGTVANAPETMVRDPRQRAVHSLAWRMVLDRDFGGVHSDDMQRMLQRQSYIESAQDWASDDAAWIGFVDEARRIAANTTQLPPDQQRPRRPPSGG